MKFLLTGATGFLGRKLLERLLVNGHSVRALCRNPRRLANFPSVEIMPGDVGNEDAVRRCVEGCDAIFHLAALAKMWARDRREFDRTNIDALRHVVQAAIENGVKRTVYVSSFIASGPTDGREFAEKDFQPHEHWHNDSERTRHLAWRLAKELSAKGAPLVTLYPGLLYGPGDLTEGNRVVKMLLDHLHGRLPGMIGPGHKRWSYVYVDDVVEGLLLAFARGRDGEDYILGGDNATDFELFSRLDARTGCGLPRRLPYALVGLIGHFQVFAAELFGIEPQVTPDVPGIFRHEWAYSPAKAEKELGYRHRSLEVGLLQTLRWLKAAGHYRGEIRE